MYQLFGGVFRTRLGIDPVHRLSGGVLFVAGERRLQRVSGRHVCGLPGQRGVLDLPGWIDLDRGECPVHAVPPGLHVGPDAHDLCRAGDPRPADVVGAAEDHLSVSEGRTPSSERHVYRPASRRLKTLLTHLSGSKYSSTTRSLSGMIALSVIVMCSGHTLVQHTVMLL